MLLNRYRGLVLLILILAACSSEATPTATPRPTATPTPSERWGVYVRANEVSSFLDVIPAMWLNPSEDQARYRITVTRQTVLVETCYYGYDTNLQIRRERTDYSAVVVDLTTGEQVTRKHFQGTEPARCAQRESALNLVNDPVIRGELPARATYRGWVRTEFAELTAGVLPPLTPEAAIQSSLPTRAMGQAVPTAVLTATPAATRPSGTPTPTDRWGVAVVLLAGVDPRVVNWTRGIPLPWRNNEEGNPYYRVELRSDSRDVETCDYDDRYRVIRRQRVIAASLIRVEDNQLVAEARFSGSEPAECKLVETFEPGQATKVIVGTLPVVSEFERWITGELNDDPDMHITLTASPTLRPTLTQTPRVRIVTYTPVAEIITDREGIYIPTRITGLLRVWLSNMPEAWRAQDEVSARYRIDLEQDNQTIERCMYFTGATVTRVEYRVRATLTDLLTNRAIVEQIFTGSAPSECPEQPSRTGNQTINGGFPDGERFQEWLWDAIANRELELVTITPSPQP